MVQRYLLLDNAFPGIEGYLNSWKARSDPFTNFVPRYSLDNTKILIQIKPEVANRFPSQLAANHPAIIARGDAAWARDLVQAVPGEWNPIDP